VTSLVAVFEAAIMGKINVHVYDKIASQIQKKLKMWK